MVCFLGAAPISFAEERDTILPESGIAYPGGYDVNTVGNVQGKIAKIVASGSGPIRLSLMTEREEYIVLGAPHWFWKDVAASVTDGADVTVRGSKSVGKDGKLYIIAQQINVAKTKKTLVLREESGEPIWGGGPRSGQMGPHSGGFGSPSGGRIGGGSGGMGRGRR